MRPAPSRGPAPSALLHFVRLAARERLAERGAILARAVFYGLILFVFSRLWGAITHDVGGSRLAVHQLVWYLAITEWLVLSPPPLYTDVEADVRQGDLAYRLARPVPYPLAKLAEGLGDLLVRMATLAGPGFGFAWLLTGCLPAEPLLMLWILPLGLLAGVLTLLVYFAVGLTSFWLHDCRPVFWIWQKCTFILGGLLVPLELYPAWLRELALASPFAALLHGPGSIALGHGHGHALRALALLAAWILVAALGLRWAFGRSLTRLEIGGG
ncbi:MAG: ABC-2 family transporter protein [Myxococcales bacterium]|nr:ABC-2 family transporter protein [Myxococcales bacterium]